MTPVALYRRVKAYLAERCPHHFVGASIAYASAAVAVALPAIWQPYPRTFALTSAGALLVLAGLSAALTKWSFGQVTTAKPPGEPPYPVPEFDDVLDVNGTPYRFLTGESQVVAQGPAAGLGFGWAWIMQASKSGQYWLLARTMLGIHAAALPEETALRLFRSSPHKLVPVEVAFPNAPKVQDA